MPNGVALAELHEELWMSGSRTIVGLRYVLLATCVAMGFQAVAGADDFDPWTQTARYELEQRVDLGRWASAEPGSVRLWLPLPADNQYQRVLSKVIESPWKYRETQDANGNRFVYLEPGGGQSGGGEIVMRFVVERSPHAGIARSKAKPDTPLDPRRHLGAQRRIPLDGKVKQYAEEAGAGLHSDAGRIRAYFDYVTKMMKYGKYGDGWGRGDVVWACDAKYGNCTDFHSVVIGMCRSQGVAARFVMGFSIPAHKTETQINGYHCWAEAYDREFGWLPMDASEAWKSQRFDQYYGRLPSDRVEYAVGRNLILEPPQHGEPLNYFIYPYVEVNGKPAGKIPWKMLARRVVRPTTSKGELR